MSTVLRPARLLARRSLRKARFFAKSARYREFLAAHPGYELAYTPRGRWLVADTRSRLSTAQVMSANLDLVVPLLRAAGVKFFYVPSISENRVRVGALDVHSDRVLDALVAAYSDQPVYFDLFTDSQEHREVLGIELADLLRVAGRVLLVRVYRAYVWPNNAFAADGLHAAEIEFWSESDTSWKAPFANRISSDIPLAQAGRTKLTAAGQRLPTLAPFSDQAHVDLLDFPVDIVFPLPSGASEERPGLRRALRALWMHTEGFRSVFVVVKGSPPPWLDELHPQLRVVDVADINAPNDLDPRLAVADIADLSDRFVAFGDNILLRRPFRPGDCFASNGLARIWTDRGVLTPVGVPVQPRHNSTDTVRSGQGMMAAFTGGPLLDPAVDIPLCLHAPTVRAALDAAADIRALNPFDVQHAMFAQRLAVTATLRHEIIDLTSPALPRMLARAGRANSVSTLGTIEPGGETRAMLDRWYPVPSPFERRSTNQHRTGPPPR